MITRIEIDGFKTFSRFELDVGPFLAVLGPNAAGKSNLFDAIQFLRRVTEDSLTVAVQEARGDLVDLFRRRGDGSRVPQMAFAVEVLLEPKVRDPWGTEVKLTQTRIRYELTISWREDVDGNIRLFVEREEASPLRRRSRDLVKRWSANREFVNSFILDGGRTSNFLETGEDAARGRFFQIRQDGVQGRARPAEAAEATVLSSMTSAEFKHLYALKQEISSWRFLQLEPNSLRLPGERFGEDRLLPDGSNLARVLSRIQRETASAVRPSGVLSDISTDLAALIPGVVGVSVQENPQTKKWEVNVHTDDEGTFRADVASDGTMRVLALLAALYDPKYRGLICFEEPENGVHPFRLKRLVKYLRQLATDPSSPDQSGEPLAQIILNSHSPIVLRALPAEDCIFVDPESIIETIESDGGSRRVKSRGTRYRRLIPRDQPPLLASQATAFVTSSEIDRFAAAAALEDEVS